MPSKSVPPDKINLKLIHVSSKTAEFLCSPSDNVSIITQRVYNDWPEQWADEQRPQTNILRLIYQGRFLHGNVTLGALHLMPGKTAVMHLVVRENLPEPNSQSLLKKEKTNESRCMTCCAIL